jgi:hypothetical protein
MSTCMLGVHIILVKSAKDWVKFLVFFLAFPNVDVGMVDSHDVANV